MRATWLDGPERSLTRFGEVPHFREGLYQIAQDTYAWMVPNGSWGETNLGLIDCRGSSVLVDTGWDLPHTKEMLDTCQPITQASPIDLVINTHADGDHCWGNQLFHGRDIIATQACLDQMHHIRPASMRALSVGTRVLRHVSCCGLHQFGHYMHEMLAPYDFKGVQITPPTQTFQAQKHLQVRGVDVEILEVGPGHTQGDAIVHLPSRRVAFAGDILFVGVTPVMWAGPPDKLTQALKRLQGLGAAVVVPGHGPLATPLDIQHALDYWDWAVNALATRHRSGMNPNEAARDILLGRDWLDRPWSHWDSPERLLTSAHTLYRHWGTPPSTWPGTLGTLALFHAQAQLAFDLPQATPRRMRHR